MHLVTPRIAFGPLVVVGCERARALANGRVVGVRRGPPTRDRLAAGGEQLVATSGLRRRRLAEQPQLPQLLRAEAQPAADLRVDSALARGLVGDVEQGARGGDRDPVGAERADRRVDRVEGAIGAGDPDVAPVDHAERQARRALTQRRQRRVELAGRAHEVEVELARRKRQHPLERADLGEAGE